MESLCVSGKMAKNLIDLGNRVGAHGMENPEEVLEPKELESGVYYGLSQEHQTGS